PPATPGYGPCWCGGGSPAWGGPTTAGRPRTCTTSAATRGPDVAGIPTEPGARPLRVLVVDDEPAVADTLALTLGRRGYDVRTAYDGWVALWAAEEFRPDAVLLDLAMP